MDEYVDDLYDEEVEAETSEEEAVDAFLQEALQRFERAKDHDRVNRIEAYDDIRFVADPQSQWLEEDRTAREAQGRPCPSLNRLKPFLKQVANDMRMNNMSITVSPAESDDRSSADLIEGIVRHIEVQSDASTIYPQWGEDGVTCGIGHVRGEVVEARGSTGAAELRVGYIADPLSVIWDPSSVERTREDARYCFVVDYLPKDEIDAEYEDALGEWPDEEEATAWTDWSDAETDELRVVEYYCMKTERVRVFEVPSFDGMQRVEVRGDEEVPQGLYPVSETTERVCKMWILTTGKVLVGGLEGVTVPGPRIPIFPYVAEEKRIGRRAIRKGMVRDSKDSVRLINWSMALLVEAMASAPKPKWTGPAKAFEGYEDEWENANTTSKAYLPYNDSAQNAPTYNQPPAFNASLVQAMSVFDENIKQVTGIYDASLGARSNETSGKAIMARERQGDTATFDYIDNFSAALRALGRWMVEVIPQVYSDERMIRIVGKDEQSAVVAINSYDPATNQPVNPIERAVYDVVVKTGPGFSTRREEASTALLELSRSAPQLAPILADLMVENQDWPNAEKVTARLRAMLPPQIQAMESGQPMPPPQPNPKDIASAKKDMADAEKTQAEAQQIRLESAIMQLQAILAGLPPQFAPQAPAGLGQGAPNGQPMPGIVTPS